MSEKPATSDATIQMSPEDVARLHRHLAGETAPEPAAEAETLEPEAPEPKDSGPPERDPSEIPTTRARARDLAFPPARQSAPEEPPAPAPAVARPTPHPIAPAPARPVPAPLATTPVRAAPARAPRPAAAAHADDEPASVPVMVGAIGIFLALAGLVLLFLPNLQGMGRDTEGPGFLAFSVAHIFVAVGFFAAATRTSGVAILVGIFSILVAVAFGAAFLMEARVIESAGLAKPVVAAVLVMPGLTWLLVGIWGFVGLKPLAQGLGIPAGIFGMLGGLAGAAGGILLLAGIPKGAGTDDDLHVLLAMVAHGGIALAMLFTAIGFIAKVARAPRLN